MGRTDFQSVQDYRRNALTFLNSDGTLPAQPRITEASSSVPVALNPADEFTQIVQFDNSQRVIRAMPDATIITDYGDIEFNNGYALSCPNEEAGTITFTGLMKSFAIHAVTGHDKGIFNVVVRPGAAPIAVDCYRPPIEEEGEEPVDAPDTLECVFDLADEVANLGETDQNLIQITSAGTKNASSDGTELIFDIIETTTTAAWLQVMITNQVSALVTNFPELVTAAVTGSVSITNESIAVTGDVGVTGTVAMSNESIAVTGCPVVIEAQFRDSEDELATPVLTEDGNVKTSSLPAPTFTEVIEFENPSRVLVESTLSSEIIENGGGLTYHNGMALKIPDTALAQIIWSSVMDSFKIYAVKGPGKGIFTVYIRDGVGVEVDCYSALADSISCVFDLADQDVSLGSVDLNKIYIIVLGTKNGASTSTELIFDYIEITTNAVRQQVAVTNFPTQGTFLGVDEVCASEVFTEAGVGVTPIRRSQTNGARALIFDVIVEALTAEKTITRIEAVKVTMVGETPYYYVLGGLDNVVAVGAYSFACDPDKLCGDVYIRVSGVPAETSLTLTVNATLKY